MIRFATLFAAVAGLAACSPPDARRDQPEAAPSERRVAPVLLTPEARDVHSFARPEVGRVTHVALDLTADFQAKRLGGTATLDVETRGTGDEVVLDAKGLEIAAVTDAGGRPLRYALGRADPVLGAPLTVRLGGARRIRIAYRSAPEAEALQWLTPQQTAGKKHPYLFSQGQAILNRTWIPTQDSPGIRQTWEARITVPEPLRVVMSAEDLTPQGEKVTGGRAYRFRMNQPVAPYLIAIAAGDIAFQPIGPRTGVYSEPSMLKASAAEFADIEKMMEAAESLYGPYRWGRYDMLMLPPAFPFGGMENPRLTFLTPTILAGDKSLVSTVAHELAHSWSGNLVTNANWAGFWLNEGFTTYFTSRIMERIYGKEATEREISLGWDDLQRVIGEAGGLASPGTILDRDLKGVDLDDAMTELHYEKGAVLLRTIEQAVGRPRFDAYLRSYFDRYAFQPITSALFLQDIRANLIKGDAALERRLKLDEWVYKPGIPDNAAPVPAQSFAAADAAARAYGAGAAVSAVPFARWSTAERMRFLSGLPRTMPKERLAALDQGFGLSELTNSEVLFAWLKLAIGNRYDPAVPALDRFLTGMGRRKFVGPLFEALVAQGEWGRPIAARILAKARSSYHPVTLAAAERALAAK